MLVFDVKNAQTVTKMPRFGVFSPLILFITFFYRFWKIRGLRAAMEKSEIVTSSDHLKGYNLVKINFFQKMFLHCAEYVEIRKLSFDTTNAKIEQKIMKSKGGHNNPPCPSM